VGSEFVLQVIYIDDGSDTNAAKILSEYKSVQRLTAEGASQAAGWNAAIKAARGKYIAFLDAADLWLPRRLFSHLAILETHEEFGAVYGQALTKADGKDILFPEAAVAPAGAAFEAFLLGLFVHPSSLIVRKEIFDKAGSFDEALFTTAYYEMLLRLAFFTRIAFVSSPVTINRAAKDPAALTETQQTHDRRELLYTIDKATALLSDKDRAAELKRAAIKGWFLEVARWLDRPEKNGLLRAHILSSLKENPWMARDTAICDAILSYASKVLFRTTQADSSLVRSSLRSFCDELKETCNGSYAQNASHARRLLGDTLTRTAKQMWHAGNLRAAGYTATYAVCQDFGQIPRQLHSVSNRFIRSFLSS
jgi:hypothetical protein